MFSIISRDRVRVSCGHLCVAEAPTEATAETPRLSVEYCKHLNYYNLVPRKQKRHREPMALSLVFGCLLREGTETFPYELDLCVVGAGFHARPFTTVRFGMS